MLEYDKVYINCICKEIPLSKLSRVLDFETMLSDQKNELRLIGEEMAYVLIYRLLEDLEPIEQLIIRHQFGLPKTYDRDGYYTVKSRLQLAKEIQDHPYFRENKLTAIDPIRKEIKNIRERALKKLFIQLWFNDDVKQEIQDISQ